MKNERKYKEKIKQKPIQKTKSVSKLPSRKTKKLNHRKELTQENTKKKYKFQET